MVLETTLPFAPTTAAVTLTTVGQVLARRARSAARPEREARQSSRGIEGRRSRNTLVRWTAHDADGGPLTSTVDYSPDGGRHWKVVADRVTGQSVRVPSRFLSASRDGRLRVRISDGFNATTVTSGRLLARGMPPVVQIIGGPRRGHVRATATLLLKGAPSTTPRGR